MEVEKSPWWLEYRRRQYKLRQTMSIEMILRKSFIQILKEYANNCSLPGVRQLCETDIDWKRRCLLAMLLGSMLGLVWYFLLYIWFGTLANPLILMPQYSTYSIANIDYPAVALCNVNRISMKNLKYVASELFKAKALGNVSIETVEHFLMNMGRLLDFSYVNTWGDTPFLDIEAFTRRHNFDSQRVIYAMRQLAPNCEEMMLKCTWNRKPVDCMSIFSTRLTARGHCCAFNYILDYDEAGLPLLKTQDASRPSLSSGDTPQVPVISPTPSTGTQQCECTTAWRWINSCGGSTSPYELGTSSTTTFCRSFRSIPGTDSEGIHLQTRATCPNKSSMAKRQNIPGFMHGLNVILDPILQDYAYPPTAIQGFDVFLFDPSHFADPSAGRVVHRLAEPNRVEFLELKAIKQTASPEIRKYPQKIRKCLFQDEKREEYHDLYSYSACIIRCRIVAVLSLCQCTPYFLPIGRQEGPICLLSDLKCLNKYKEKLSYLYPAELQESELFEFEDSLHCPECLPDCEHTRHVIKSFKTSINIYSIDKYFSYGFSQGINMTNKSVLSIYYVTPGGDLERLDVVSYWYQVISNIGGFSGILIGFSVFSAVEIVYYIFLRFAQVTYKNYIEYY